MNLVEAVGKVLSFFALVLLFVVIFTYPVMLLWNGCLVPAVSGVHTITWLQALGLLILASFFKGSVSARK